MCSSGWYSSLSRWKTPEEVLSIYQKVGSAIAPEYIDDCHPLGKNNDRVVVKFIRKKDCKKVIQIKEDLKDLTADDLNLPGGTKYFWTKVYAHIIAFLGQKLNACRVWVK